MKPPLAAAINLTPEQWVAGVVVFIALIMAMVWVIRQAFTWDDRYAHQNELDKLMKRVEDLEKALAHLPTDEARRGKLSRAFEQLTKTIMECEFRPENRDRKRSE